MSKTVLWPLGLVALAALIIGCVVRHGSAIEADLTAGSTAALTGAGIAGVSAQTDGRDVTLAGAVADETDRRRALVAVSAVRGVRRVRDRLTVGAAAAVTRAAPDTTAAADTTALATGDQITASGDPALAGAEAALGAALSAGRIEFESGTARLTEPSRQLLDRVAAVFTRFPDVGADIWGHTDSEGDRAPNRTLSTRRAEATRDYLAQTGVDADRLRPRGVGEAEPVADNDTEAGRARNRRVVFALRPL
ncbi:MAG TPA: OmpA family protein [Rubricoccaceae bacterium]